MKKIFVFALLSLSAISGMAQDDMYFGKKEMKAEVDLPEVKTRNMDVDEYNRHFTQNNYIPVLTDSLGNDIINWNDMGAVPDSTDIVDTLKVRRHFVYIDTEWYRPYYYGSWRYGWYDTWYNPWYDPWCDPWYRPYGPWYDPWLDPWLDPWWYPYGPWGPYRPWSPWSPWYGPTVVVHYPPIGTRNHSSSFRSSNGNHRGTFSNVGTTSHYGTTNRTSGTTRPYGTHNYGGNPNNRYGTYSGNRTHGNQPSQPRTNYNGGSNYGGHSGGYSGGGGHSGGFSGSHSGGFSGGGHSGGFSGGGRRR